MYDMIRKGLMFGTHYQSIDMNLGIIYSTLDVDFRVTPPVYDNGLSQIQLTCDRDSTQPDGKGGEVAKNTPVTDQYGVRTNGEFEQVCQWSEDPGGWSSSGTPTVTATGDLYGPFIEYLVTDNGANWNRIRPYDSAEGGNPTGVLYFCILYKPGTSGNIFVRAFDQTDVLSSEYSGVIGSATVKSNTAGTLHVISDVYDAGKGYYILKGSMLFTNLSNLLNIGIGPYSTDNSNIKVLGADVSEDIAALSIHTTSEGSNVTVATNYSYDDAGTPKGVFFKDGPADGVELFTGLDALGDGCTDNLDGSYTWDGTQSAPSVSSEDGILTGGDTFELNYQISGYGGGSITPTFGVTGGVALTARSSDGSFTDSAVNPSGANNPTILQFVAGSDFIGTISLISTKQVTKIGLSNSMPDFFDVLDGKADGDILLNDDFSIDTTGNYTGPVYETNLTYESSEFMRATFTTGNNNKGFRANILVPIGNRYSVTFRAKGTRVSSFVSIGANGDVGSETKNPTLSASWQEYEFIILASDTAFRFYMGTGSIGDVLDIDDILIKQISPAQGKIWDTWRPGFSVDDIPNDTIINIATVNGDADGLVYAYKDASGDGWLMANDGTNTVAVALDWDADTDYPLALVFDTDEMQIQQGDNASAVGTFAGDWGCEFGEDGTMFYSYENPYPQYPARHQRAVNYSTVPDWKEPT